MGGLLLLRLAPASGAQSGAHDIPLVRCHLGRVTESGLVLDGHPAYIEPQTFAPLGDRALLAGRPSYVWGAGDALVPDSVMGAVLDRAGRATPLRAPIASRLVHEVRAVALTPGDWAVAFAEAEPTPNPGVRPHVTAYWFGRTDGTHWRALTRLPLPDDSVLSELSSALIRTPTGVALAVPLKTATAWAVEVLRWQGEDPATAERVPLPLFGEIAVGVTRTGTLVLGITRGDPDAPPPEEGSLFLYESAREGWIALPRLVRGGTAPVQWPHLDRVDGGDLLVTWHTTAPWFSRPKVPAAPGAFAIRAPTPGRAIGQPVIALADSVEDLVVAVRGATPFWIVAAPPGPTGAPLRVLTLGTHDTVSTVVGRLASPFTRPMAGGWLGEHLVLASGVARRAPTEAPVTTHVLRLAIACR